MTVFEMLPKAGKDVGKSTKWVLMGILDRFGVSIRTNAKVLSIQNGWMVYEINGKHEEELFDSIILASGSRSRQDLSRKVELLGILYTCIGDCIKPGKLNHAVHGGFLAALSI